MIADVYIHPALPALVRVFGSDFNSVEHVIAINDEDEIILDAQIQDMYYVVDLYDLTISLDDMIKTADEDAPPFKNSRHQHVIENLIIVPHAFYERAVQTFQSPLFDNLPLKICASMEEALSYMEDQQEIAH
jgi:hypothetical protein